MLLGKGLLVLDEGEGVEEDEGVSDLPHSHGLWSSRHRGWMDRGSGPMALVGLPLDLAQWPSFWPFRHT